MGRPCCAVFACRENLQSNRHRYCKTHFNMHQICAIQGCGLPVLGENSKTCGDPTHKQAEAKNKEKGASMFILKERFRSWQPLLHPLESLPTKSESAPQQDLNNNNDDMEWFELDMSGNIALHSQPNPGTVGVSEDTVVMEPCPSKPVTGNRVIKAQFGRRRTHNEQTLVRPCGIIYARATMFGTEAVSNFLVCIANNSSLLVGSNSSIENGGECLLHSWCSKARTYLL